MGARRWLGYAGAVLVAVRAGAAVPFLPVPEIDVDPNSGTTLGLIPTWIQTDDMQVIRRIVAPDVIYNPYFGYGARARVFAFPSADAQWSIVGGGKQRVEREFNANYESGRLVTQPWSRKFEAVYDRSGTPRFYGFGNRSAAIDQTDYTNQQLYLQGRIARRLGRGAQLAYTVRLRSVDVTPGSLANIASLDRRFGRILGTGLNREVLTRLSFVYDTRDDPTVPTRGAQLITYAGVAARHGFLNASLYSEAGLDARGYWPLKSSITLAGHVALRYLPSTHHTPFWAMSSIGGAASELDGSQPLRGFGTSRFYDRNAFSTSWELRWTVRSFAVAGSSVDLQLTPFADAGRVFHRAGTAPFSHLHYVGGLGFRGVARPTVVGYVDIGYGSEGVAVFTGINYPI
jgi:outer membrane protein assembly factor BamA